MMNDNRDQWIGEVLNSMRGSSRAQPSPDVWASIESKRLAEATVVSLPRLRMAAAAGRSGTTAERFGPAPLRTGPGRRGGFGDRRRAGAHFPL